MKNLIAVIRQGILNQVDTSRTKYHVGSSGLGLAMVKWIIEIHGGRISAESRYGEGTEFKFYLPISKENKE